MCHQEAHSNVSSGSIFECVIWRHIRMCHQEAYSNVLSDAHSNVSSDAHSNVSPDDTFKRIYSFLNILSSLLSADKGGNFCPNQLTGLMAI